MITVSHLLNVLQYIINIYNIKQETTVIITVQNRLCCANKGYLILPNRINTNKSREPEVRFVYNYVRMRQEIFEIKIEV